MVLSYGKIPHLELGMEEYNDIVFFIQEKLDGSQFKVRWENDQVVCDSKKVKNTTDSGFAEGVESAREIFTPFYKTYPEFQNYVFCFEYLKKPKHNTLKYNCIPTNHLCLFDIYTGERYMDINDLQWFHLEYLAPHVDLIPCIEISQYEDLTLDQIKEWLKQESYLGGCKIEGIVLKCNTRYVLHPHANEYYPVRFKYVSEEFKESNHKNWSKKQAGMDGFIQSFKDNEPRWTKAVFHLRDEGKLEHSPRDIGSLMKELERDFWEEEEERIKNVLLGFVRGRINKNLKAGFAEWYKEKLAAGAFK